MIRKRCKLVHVSEGAHEIYKIWATSNSNDSALYEFSLFFFYFFFFLRTTPASTK